LTQLHLPQNHRKRITVSKNKTITKDYFFFFHIFHLRWGEMLSSTLMSLVVSRI